MRTDNDWGIHNAFGDCGTDFVPQTAGGDIGHDPRFDMSDQWFMDIGDGTRGNRKILDAHFCDLVQNEIHDKVPFAKMMVEGDRHAVR